MINRHLGYYVCDGQEFQSKIRCALHASQTKQPITWVFNDDIFKAYDWSVEPQSGLDELYDRRTRELREKYDYLVLNYSGGSDCHNILMSFYRQGLLLDEIVSNWIFDASRKLTVYDSRVISPWNQNAEFELGVKQKLDWVRNHMPRTRVSVYDCGQQIYSYFANAKDESWILDAIGPLNPAAVQRYNSLSIKEIRERIDKQKKIGIILGVDKPRALLSGNKLNLCFIDTQANIIPASAHFSEYDNSTIEYFYWSPESCDILAKQSHVILRHLQTNKHLQPVWQYAPWIENTNQIRETLLKDIIYTTWDDAFQVNKPMMDWFSEYDYWFTEQLKITPAGKNWTAGIDYLKKHLDPRLFASDRGFYSFTSPIYYIGELS